MDDLTLREKLDAIEACEKLMEYYQKGLHDAVRLEQAEEDEETVGYDYSHPVRQKYEYYKNLRDNFIHSLEKDNILQQAEDKNRSLFK